MPVYMVEEEHDVALVDLDVITPQPRANWVEPVEVNQGISGKSHWQGWCIELHWDFIETQEEYITLLSQFNLESNIEYPVTLYCQNFRGYWSRFNGLAHLPIPGKEVKRERFFIRDLTIYVTDMEPI